MLDINYIIENKEHVKELLKRKLYEADVDSLVLKVEEKRKLQKKTEDNKAEQNKLSKSVPQVKKEGGDVNAIFAKVKVLVLYALPNLPDEDLLGGGKENNKPIYYYKDKPEFNFKVKSHVELEESLGLIDYNRAAKVSGHGTWFLDMVLGSILI